MPKPASMWVKMLIVITVKDQGWNVKPLQVFRQIRLGERLDAIVGSFMTGQHPLHPEKISQTLRDLGSRPVGAVERGAEILEELRAIGEHSSAKLIEYFDRQAAGIRRRLQHERRYGANQHRLGHTLGSVAAAYVSRLLPSQV